MKKRIEAGDRVLITQPDGTDLPGVVHRVDALHTMNGGTHYLIEPDGVGNLPGRWSWQEVRLDDRAEEFVRAAVARGGNPEAEECFDSGCPGYFAENDDNAGIAYAVARCDACARFPGDVEAARQYAIDKFDGLGYVVTAWRDGEQGALGRGSDSVNVFANPAQAWTYAAELMKTTDDSTDRPWCMAVQVERVSNLIEVAP